MGASPTPTHVEQHRRQAAVHAAWSTILSAGGCALLSCAVVALAPQPMAYAEADANPPPIARVTEELCPDGQPQNLRPDGPLLVITQYADSERVASVAVYRALYADGRLFGTEFPGPSALSGGFRIHEYRLGPKDQERLVEKIRLAALAEPKGWYDVSKINLGKYHVGECYDCPPYDLEVVLWIEGCRKTIDIMGIDICTLQILAKTAEPWCAALAKRDVNKSPLVQRQKRMAALPAFLGEALRAMASLRLRGGSPWCKGGDCFLAKSALPYQEEWFSPPEPRHKRTLELQRNQR